MSVERSPNGWNDVAMPAQAGQQALLLHRMICPGDGRADGWSPPEVHHFVAEGRWRVAKSRRAKVPGRWVYYGGAPQGTLVYWAPLPLVSTPQYPELTHKECAELLGYYEDFCDHKARAYAELYERVLHTLDDKTWEAFLAELEAPPKALPAVAELFRTKAFGEQEMQVAGKRK